VSARSELEEAVRAQVILAAGGAGPLVGEALKRILVAVDVYTKSQKGIAEVCLAYDTPSRVEAVTGCRPEPGQAFFFKGRREFCEELRGDLESARELARRKA
jgi:hypothetical protein